MSRHPLYALTAILSIALGIGATTAVYSVLYGVLVDPYPYADAKRIAVMTLQRKQNQRYPLAMTMSEAQQLRQIPAVEDVLLEWGDTMLDTDGELPLSVNVQELSGNGLQFLGDGPAMGRTFTANEAPEGAAPPPVAVISSIFWKTHFASDPHVVGRTLALSHRTYTVIGVMGPRFTWRDADVYMPLAAGMDPKLPLDTEIRLRRGAPMAIATAQVDSALHQLGRAHPELLPRGEVHIRLETLNEWLLGQFKGMLLVLFAAVGLLLLIGCGNVSILMLARATARQQELAMRAAVGASRLRLTRQLLTEAVVLSLSGGLAGVGIAYAVIHLILTLLPEYAIPHEVMIQLNVPVLVFSTIVSVLVGIAAGLSPAIQFARPQLGQFVQTGGTRTTTSRGSHTRSAMIVAQVALTVLLLAGAGAAIRHFLEAYRARLGFEPRNVLMLFLNLPAHSYATWQERVRYYDALTEAVRTVPGVRFATLSSQGVPPRGNWVQQVNIVGQMPEPGRQTGVQLAGADYFETLKIPLLRGRTLTRAEVLRGAHLAVVSQLFAQRYFNGADPIERSIVPVELAENEPGMLPAPGAEQPYQVVGVVSDVRNVGLHRPILPQVYVASSILADAQTMIFVRTAGDPRQLVRAISQRIRNVDQNQTVGRSWAFEDYLSAFAWSQERFVSVLFTIFSVVAFGLAAIGLFSVVAYAVEQRTREVGIRVALGAGRVHVLRVLLTPTLWTTAAGLLLGVLLSVGMSNVLYRWTESSMRDGMVLGGIAAVLLAATAFACLLPARRALRVDPVTALRAN